MSFGSVPVSLSAGLRMIYNVFVHTDQNHKFESSKAMPDQLATTN